MSAFLKFTDPQGHTIMCAQFEPRGGGVAYNVEVLNESKEVVDRYTLYGHTGLEHTSKKRKWKEVQDA